MAGSGAGGRTFRWPCSRPSTETRSRGGSRLVISVRGDVYKWKRGDRSEEGSVRLESQDSESREPFSVHHSVHTYLIPCWPSSHSTPFSPKSSCTLYLSQVVLLVQVLTHEINHGYKYSVVPCESFNGTKFANLKQLSGEGAGAGCSLSGRKGETS